jgi:DNA processing protein
VWEELPTQIRLQLEARLQLKVGDEFTVESKVEAGASLFEPVPLPRAEALVFRVLRHDEALLLDEIMEKLESELSSSEIFTALFELELSGRVKQLPGRNYVKSF